MKLIVHVTQSTPDSYKAQCPALPGCVAAGRTRQEAMRNIESAIHGYLASLVNYIPERVQPQVYGA